MKYGKTPARNAIEMKFSDHAQPNLIRPSSFGHDGLIKAGDWNMGGNDKYGSCVPTGGGNETRMWNYEAGVQTYIPTSATLSDYSAISGFDPSKPDTDNGCDMEAAAKYRRNVGLIDGHGKRHKIGAYLALDPGNLEQHLQAGWLFGAVGIGLEVPAYMERQFDAGKPLDVDPNEDPTSIGGHYAPMVGYRDGMIWVVTWAKVVPMTVAFLTKFSDEAITYVSSETLKGGYSPEGFDLPSLDQRLASLKSGDAVA